MNSINPTRHKWLHHGGKINKIIAACNKFLKMQFSQNDFIVDTSSEQVTTVSLRKSFPRVIVEPFTILKVANSGTYDYKCVAGTVQLFLGDKTSEKKLWCDSCGGEAQNNYDYSLLDTNNPHIYLVVDVDAANATISNVHTQTLADVSNFYSNGSFYIHLGDFYDRDGELCFTQKITGDIELHVVLPDGAESSNIETNSLDYAGAYLQLYKFADASQNTAVVKINDKIQYVVTNTVPSSCGCVADPGDLFAGLSCGNHKHVIDYAANAGNANFANSSNYSSSSGSAGMAWAVINISDHQHSELSGLNNDDHQQYWLVNDGYTRNKGSSIGKTNGVMVIDLNSPALVGNWSYDNIQGNTVTAANANVGNINVGQLCQVNHLTVLGNVVTEIGNGANTDTVVLNLDGGGTIKGKFIRGIFVLAE